MYDSWDMEHDRQNLFSFWTIFCPFTPPLTPYNPENQNFEKIKKTPGDIIILHKCNINDNHIWYMVPEIWSKVHQMKFLSSLATFCHFTALTAWKIRISKKMKTKSLEKSSVKQLHPKSWSYAILFLTYGTWQM